MSSAIRSLTSMKVVGTATESGTEKPKTSTGKAPAKPAKAAPASDSYWFPKRVLAGAVRGIVPSSPGIAPQLDKITSGYPEGLPVIFENNSTPYQNPQYIDTPWPNWKDGEFLNFGKKTDEDIAWIAESEVIHGRWAMLGCAGAWGAEVGTGVPWFKTGALCTPTDCTAMNTIFPGQIVPLAPEGFGPNFWTVVAIEFAVFGTVEAYRAGWNKASTPNRPWMKNNEQTWEKLQVGDVHPGGVHFDPLGLEEKFDIEDMKVAELKHARLAMLSWLGYMAQAFQTNGASLGPKYPHEIEGAVGPYANWQAHIADPVHENVWKYWQNWNEDFLGIIDIN